MSKFFKYTLIAGASLVGLVGTAAAVVYGVSTSKLNRNYTVAVQAHPVPTGTEALLHGRHLFTTRGCADCHGADGGGDKVVEDPAIGRLFGPNLSKGSGSVTANYTTQDWERSIRHGVNPSGRPLLLMPSHEYSRFSEADMGSLIAYLQQLDPVDRPSGPVQLGPVGHALVATGQFKLAAAIIDHANIRPAEVIPGITLEYGRYLAAGCTGCHGDNFSGGKIMGAPPSWPAAANLTPHSDGRVKNWSEADFLNTLRTARRPDGSEVHPVMPRAYAQMTDVELKALWTYLQTLAPATTGNRDVAAR